ncbi:MAG TPA: glycosyltransferase [Candidatus Acidoferrum sp.]|nr:glycosyltransferase [Candidatus Acidoferrum sp.]
MAPRVSIGLPVYNGAKYLHGSLASLLKQDFEDFELIISDNASTDDTEEICRSYAATDRRIRYQRNRLNVGSARNYRQVFESARGEFFKWCSHDDVCRPAFVRRCLDVFDAEPSSVVLVYPLCDLIDEAGTVIGRARGSVETRQRRPHRRLAHVLRNFSYAYPIWGVIRTECLRKSGLTGSVWYWDEVLLAELALYGQIIEIPEVLSEQRCHQENALALCSAGQGTEVAGNPSKANRTTRRALRTWADPLSHGGMLWLPNQEEHYWEYAKRIHRSPLPTRDKLLCYQIIPFVCYWGRLKKLGGSWKRKLRRSRVGSLSDGRLYGGVQR